MRSGTNAKALRTLRSRVGRVMRDVERRIDAVSEGSRAILQELIGRTDNNAAAGLAPRLFTALGRELLELFTEEDGKGGVPLMRTTSQSPVKVKLHDTGARLLEFLSRVADPSKLVNALCAEHSDGFALARSWRTTPVGVMRRFEAENGAALACVQVDFRRVTVPEKPGAKLPF